MTEYSEQSHAAGFSRASRLSEATRLSHAYITDGQNADVLAAAGVCSGGGADAASRPCGHCRDCEKASKNIHPDIIRIDIPKGKRGIVVDQIREIKTDVYIAPNEAARKVYVVNNADTMNSSAQNAFLQILEEPPAHAIFILKASNPAALLDTVRSRCVDTKTRSEALFNTEDLQEISQLADDFIAAPGDNLQLTQCMFRLDKLGKPAFSDFITLAREKLALALRENPQRKYLFKTDDLLTKADEMLDLNLNVGYISGMLCASLIEEAS